MKTQRFLFYLSICILPFLAGCPKKYTVITTINKDGSGVRMVGEYNPSKFEGIDSVLHNLPVPIDDTWSLDTINDTTAFLMKEFDSIEELNELYENDESTFRYCKRKVAFEKEFKWFYWIYRYSETFGGILTEFPLENYLLKDEVEAFKADTIEDYLKNIMVSESARTAISNNIDQRIGYWLNDHIYSKAFNDIVSIADSMGLLNRNNYNLDEVKDSIHQYLDQESRLVIDFENSDQLGMAELSELIGLQLGIDAQNLDKLKNEISLLDLQSKYEEQIFFGLTKNYDHLVIMPGLLIDTNASAISGDTLEWDIEAELYLPGDYTLYAESRVTNLWAYYVSGIIVLMAMIIPFIRKKKR